MPRLLNQTAKICQRLQLPSPSNLLQSNKCVRVVELSSFVYRSARSDNTNLKYFVSDSPGLNKSCLVAISLSSIFEVINPRVTRENPPQYYANKSKLKHKILRFHLFFFVHFCIHCNLDFKLIYFRCRKSNWWFSQNFCRWYYRKNHPRSIGTCLRYWGRSYLGNFLMVFSIGCYGENWVCVYVELKSPQLYMSICQCTSIVHWLI